MQSSQVSKPPSAAVVSLPPVNRFTGKNPLAVAEIIQRENPGLKFFLLQPDLKKPLPGSHGWEDCTDDLEGFYDAVEFEGHGLGVVLGGQPYFCIDVDTKRQHRGATNLCRFLGYIIAPGMTEAAAVELLIEKLDTLIARTPSGGLHIYLRHNHPFRAAFPGRPEGNDYRGIKGYVVFPGTHTEASADPSGNTFTGTYEIVKDRPIALASAPILAALVDVNAPGEKKAGAAIGEPVKLKEFMEVLAWVNPDHSREKWIVQAGCFHNTNLVDAEGESLEEEKLEIWQRFCRGELWKGPRDKWVNGLPSYYTGDGDAEMGYGQIGPKEGGAGYGSLVHEARRNGYSPPSLFDTFADELLPEVTKAKSGQKTLAEEIADSLVSYEEFCQRHDLTEYLIPGMVPFLGTTYFYGPRGDGKTAALVSLVMCGQADEVWMERQIEKGCSYVYIALEDPSGVRTSIGAWLAANNQVALNPRRFKLFDYELNFLATNAGEVLKGIELAVRRSMDCNRVIFIIDTHQRSAPASQNDEEKMTVAVEMGERLAKMFNGALLVAGHSPGSNPQKLSGTLVMENRSFGLINVLKSPGFETDRLRHMVVRRVKGSAEGAIIKYEIKGQVLPDQLDSKGRPVEGAIAIYRGGSMLGDEAEIAQAKLLEKKRILAEDVAMILREQPVYKATGEVRLSLTKAVAACAGREGGCHIWLEGGAEPQRKVPGKHDLRDGLKAMAGPVWLLRGGQRLQVVLSSDGPGMVHLTKKDDGVEAEETGEE